MFNLLNLIFDSTVFGVFLNLNFENPISNMLFGNIFILIKKYFILIKIII